MSYRGERKRRHSNEAAIDSENEWNTRSGSYDPIKVGSSDGMDDEPHDRGLSRALNVFNRNFFCFCFCVLNFFS